MLADTLGVEEYYSTALDQGVGPRPNTVVRNGDGTTTLGWTIATISSTASVTIEFTARPSLLLHSGDVKVAAASAAATNTNGCVVAPVNASASTLIAEVPISGRPISHGRWRTDASLRTDEIRARVQATDQRFDVSPVIGELSDAEVVTGLKGDNGQATELRSRLLATLLNLANRAISSSTSVDSVQARRLGIVDVASAVRYVEATLALDPVANSSRYIDAKQLLDAINGPG